MLQAELATRATGVQAGAWRRVRVSAKRQLPAMVAFAAIAPVAAANGGYDPASWGWAAAALLWVAGMALVLRERLEFTRHDLRLVAALTGLACWMLLSSLWSGDLSNAALEAERAIVYAAAAAALLLVSRRGSAMGIAAGALAAIVVTVLDGLANVIFPSALASSGVAQTGRLAAPIGYWNGLGIIAAIGVLLALGLAARSESLAGRLATAVVLPPLAIGLYLTFSRGAWISLAFGLVIAVIIDQKRWQLLATAALALPWLALDVLLTAHSWALTHIDSPVGPTIDQSHRLAAAAVASALPVCLGIVALQRLERRWSPSALMGQVGRGLGIAAVAAVLIVPTLAYGSPVNAAARLYDGFAGSAPGGFKSTPAHAGQTLNNRLFNLSGNGRVLLWKAALAQYEQHPLLGAGAGQFGPYWLTHRTTNLKVVDAHNLYLETLDELGPVGLLLLLTALGAPLLVLRRVRRVPIAAALAGAYAAFLLHASADWDWELPAVTLTGLVCGCGLLVAARTENSASAWPSPARWLGVALSTVVAVVALAGLRVNLAISESAYAAASQNYTAAGSQARAAIELAPWMEPAWLALGEAELGQTQDHAAAASFRHATRLDPGDWKAWFGLARATSGATRRAALRRAEALDPREPAVILFAGMSTRSHAPRTTAGERGGTNACRLLNHGTGRWAATHRALLRRLCTKQRSAGA